jgi:heat shock protein HtpX
MSSVFKTGLLLAALTAMLVLIGGAIGGQQGMVVAFVIALVMNFVSYWFSDKIVLAAYRAQPIDEASAPRLYPRGSCESSTRKSWRACSLMSCRT